ncbi:hypothetical protein I3843_16G032100 [Carya illinoinensis]|nr:hypothetical protein I3843_16G032100 [Carya illinoinensis]
MEVHTTSRYWSKTNSTFKSHQPLRNATFCQNNCFILALPVFLGAMKHSGRSLIISSNYGRTDMNLRLRMLALPLCMV